MFYNSNHSTFNFSVKKPKIPRVSNKADAVPNMYILAPLPDATGESLRY